MEYIDGLTDIESLGFTNDVMKKIHNDVIHHYTNIVNSVLNTSLGNFEGIEFTYGLSLNNGEIYIKFLDGKTIKRSLCSTLGIEYNSKTAEQDIRRMLLDVKNIKTPDELEIKYPKFYNLYRQNVNIARFTSNEFFSHLLETGDQNFFEYFINDICYTYELIVNNINIIDEALKNNKFIVKKGDDPDTYYHILFDLVAAAALKKKEEFDLSMALKIDLPDFNIFDNHVIDLYEELKEYDKDITIYNEKTKEKITLEEVKEFFDRIVYKVIKSHGKDSSIPFFDDDKLLLKIYKGIDNYIAHEHIEYTILKYSGLFEFGYNNDNPYDVVIGLKNKYNNKTIYELFEIAIGNLRKLKPKDIYLAQYTNVKVEALRSSKNSNSISADDVIRVINSNNPNDNKEIYKRLKYLLVSKINVSIDLITKNDQSKRSYILMLYYNTFKKPDIYSMDELLTLYIDYLNNYAKENKFVKFADKTHLDNKDFDAVLSNVEQYLVDKIGKDKLSEILEKTKNVSSSNVKTIIEECLIVKKSIDDEIEEIERRKVKTLESDPSYRTLNQQLNKLKLYKEHFKSEEVIPCEGIFKEYYGFEFENDIFVFDYFTDMDEDIQVQSDKNSGHAIYILGLEDYLKVKDLSSLSEVREYIKNNLKDCAKVMNHTQNGEGDKMRLFKKLKEVSEGLKIREYILYLNRTDNPITDETIKLTQEQFDDYVRKFVADDEEIIEKLRKKRKRTKEVAEREKSVATVENQKKDEYVQPNLDSDEEKTAFCEDIDDLGVRLVEVNVEREKAGLPSLSFEKDNYYDVCRAIIEYDEKSDDKFVKRINRDARVARATKERTFYNGAYHCECCGTDKMNPLVLDSHHFIPISQGGDDDIYNTVCLCTECHRLIHNNSITDMQNYMLIETIRNYIVLHAPEALPKFEKTLGRIENKYLDQIDQIDKIAEKIKYDAEIEKEELIDQGTTTGLSDDEIEAKMDQVDMHLKDELSSLEQKKNQKLVLANRIQDYYRNSIEYKEIESRTEPSKLR